MEGGAEERLALCSGWWSHLLCDSRASLVQEWSSNGPTSSKKNKAQTISKRLWHENALSVKRQDPDLQMPSIAQNPHLYQHDAMGLSFSLYGKRMSKELCPGMD